MNNSSRIKPTAFMVAWVLVQSTCIASFALLVVQRPLEIFSVFTHPGISALRLIGGICLLALFVAMSHGQRRIVNIISRFTVDGLPGKELSLSCVPQASHNPHRAILHARALAIRVQRNANFCAIAFRLTWLASILMLGISITANRHAIFPNAALSIALASVWGSMISFSAHFLTMRLLAVPPAILRTLRAPH